MNELEPQEPPAQEAPPAPVTPPEEPDPTTGLTDDAAKINALHQALSAARGQVRELKPKAAKVDELAQQVNQLRPYADLVLANPQLTQPQAPPPEPPQPAADPRLEQYARALDLYEPTTGKPDIARAKLIRDMSREDARAEAQTVIAPVADGSNESRAAANLYSIQQSTRDADGRQLEEQYLVQAVRTMTSTMTKQDALRVLADPNVANVVKLTALGLQAASKKSSPAPPQNPPLDVESPGGSHAFSLSEDSKKLAKAAGIKEDQFTAAAKRYVPGRSNSLE